MNGKQYPFGHKAKHFVLCNYCKVMRLQMNKLSVKQHYIKPSSAKHKQKCS